MSTPLYQLKAEFFKTLGHPVRIRVLELLSIREHAVSELLGEIEIEPANLSQQLAVLAADGRPAAAVIGQGNSRTKLGDATPATRPLGVNGLKPQEAALLTSLPPAPRSFILYFDQGTTTPTAASRAVLASLRSEIASRSGPHVEVTGHTDTVGSEADNDRLSLQRAEEVLAWLASQGFDRSLMSATGRGERELKEPTIDNFSSAANRRVEVIVR